MDERRLNDDLPDNLRSSLEAIDNLRDQLDEAIMAGNAQAVSELSTALLETARKIDRQVAINESNGDGTER